MSGQVSCRVLSASELASSLCPVSPQSPPTAPCAGSSTAAGARWASCAASRSRPTCAPRSAPRPGSPCSCGSSRDTHPSQPPRCSVRYHAASGLGSIRAPALPGSTGAERGVTGTADVLNLRPEWCAQWSGHGQHPWRNQKGQSRSEAGAAGLGSPSELRSLELGVCLESEVRGIIF